MSFICWLLRGAVITLQPHCGNTNSPEGRIAAWLKGHCSSTVRGFSLPLKKNTKQGKFLPEDTIDGRWRLTESADAAVLINVELIFATALLVEK